MAEIRKVVRGNPLSNFRQGTPEAGGAFRFLAGVAEAAYTQMLPAAKQEMDAYGRGLGRDIAKGQIGDPQAAFTVSSMGESGVSASLSTTESGGNYQAQNSEGLVGKYQWGQGRLNDFNKANGTNYSLADFKASPGVQEAAQKWHEGDILSQLGQYAGTVVNGITMTPAAIVAAAHLGGIGGARKFITSGGAYDPADSNGTHLSDYAKTHGGADVTVSSSNNPYSPPTMLREADGSLTARLFSPMSGPLLQVANAAAGVAYQSDVMLKGQADLMGMSEQFQLNPEGFQQAAQQYVADLVKSAPDMFKPDLQASMETEFKRRYLGMVEEKHRDTFQRAANSNSALVDRQSNTLADAVAGGDPEAIAAAESDLRSMLAVRESLPGLSWTPEQSQNAVLDARKQGEAKIATQQKAQGDAWKGQLKTVEAAALDGRTSAFDAVLDNPLVQQLFPKEWLEAAAARQMAESLPTLLANPPQVARAAITEARKTPATSDVEVKMLEKADAAVAAQQDAFNKDPIAAAQKYLPIKPPEIPALDPQNPEAFLNGLQARSIYAEKQVADGFTQKPILLSKDEAVALGAMFAKEVPPEMKALAAQMVVQGLGAGAMPFFKQVNVSDPTIRMSGMMLASGGDAVVAVDMMRGQQMLDDGVATAPSKASSITAVSPDISRAVDAAAYTTGADTIAARSDLLAASTALYATMVPPNADEETQKRIMVEATQKALGRTTGTDGETILGGVQKVGGASVLLAPNMSGKDLNAALSMALAPKYMKDAGGNALPFGAQPNDVWQKIGMGQEGPMIGGKPIQKDSFQRGEVILTPEGGNKYRLSITRGGIIIDATDPSDPSKPFIFDADALIKAAQP